MPITVDAIPFLQPGAPWPPTGELGEERLQRYRKNRELFKGEHFRVYADMARLVREDQQATLELAVNFPGAVSKLFADLLFGELPRFVAPDDVDGAQEWVDSFITANALHRANYRAALAQSYRGEAVYKLRIAEGRSRAVAEVIPASVWYPVYDEDNVTEILGHVLAWVKTRGEGKKTVRYLRAEIHLPGEVHQKLWQLTDDGLIGREAPLSTLYASPPPERVETGVPEPLVVVVPNLELDDSPFGQDDYMEADTLFGELDVRLAQISRILDKHSDPGMYGPDTALEQDPRTGEWHVRAGGRYIPVGQGDVVPGYLTWDAQLAANWEFLKQIMHGLYIATDTNAAAFSLLESGNVPSGAALKRLMVRPLARTNRKRLFFDAALRKLFSLAAQLERAQRIQGAPAEGISVDIEWQDGLPTDPMEAAQVEQIRTGGKATSSVKSSIRRLDGGDEESIQAELDDIAADEAQGAVPAVTPTGFQFGETEE